MKGRVTQFKIILIIYISLIAGYANGQTANPCKTGGQTCYFGVEINDMLCGYSVENYCEDTLNGKPLRYEYSDVTLKMSALGADMDAGFRWRYTIDPAIQRAIEIKVDVINGESVVTTITEIIGDTAYFSNPASGVKKAVPVSPDVIITSLMWYPHLYNDFIKMKTSVKRYKVYDPIKGAVTEKGYVRKSEEQIVLSDSAFQTVVLEETDYSSGIKSILWLNKADGYNVKVVVEGRRNIYFADKSVTSRITFANIDNELFAGTDRKIPDIMNLSWLKVKAKVNSFGEYLTVQSLNFPGQKFEGSVSGSLIDGIFEVEPPRYRGENAPPFPPDFSRSSGLKKYLGAELMIESDNPLIISEASRITAGSKDSWQAAIRLSRWVAENIAGAIPGGISAINTLKTGEAECGGHSRLLAAFCRAVGIPARLSVGCMYTAYHSGGFGQHAWTEVYMGEAGWIPVDATINEPDYIDAGHIRLGENATFRPISMEVLDFRSGSKNTEATIPYDYKPLLGSYMNIEQYRMFKIIERNGGLAIDMPGRTVLDLNLPDDQGKWFPKMTREISLMPERNKEGKVDKIIMLQYFRLRKMSSPYSVINEIPDEFRKYAGKYQFAPARLSIDVMFDDGTLTTSEPLGRSKERISYLKKSDTWIDKSGSYEIGFITGDENKVVALNFTVRLDFMRGEPVTNPVEIAIKESGITAGLKKYDEIKKSGNKYYFFSEQMLHQLGHGLLKEDRIDDAIKVFKKNVHEYPGSFMVTDALAETYMKKGENKPAIKYFKIAVKLNPDYDYGKKMIEELKLKK
ncbi:MAG: lasso peptide biosynthesis protein [Bacteroidales bacterium]|nr:lasso peptide biosynthesis protein [Bacteroidales bacterium]